MENDTQISLFLYETLDKIGVSQNLRQRQQNYGHIVEIFQTFQNKGVPATYIFGSSSEGTSSPEMNSDIDQVNAFDDIDGMPIVEHLDAILDNDCYALMITDTEVTPGYVKLQFVVNRTPLTELDWSKVPRRLKDRLAEDLCGRLVFRNDLELSLIAEILPIEPCTHGPAISIESDGNIAVDIIFAYRCKYWPSMAKEWISRRRSFGWPDVNDIEEWVKFGFFLVYVGHPESKDKHLECRISFSLQERQLIFGLNDVQYKCYVFLKIIKNDLIKAITGDSITSYHCKTCLFYTIENNPSGIWIPENLFNCIIKCLQQLLEWVCCGFCPNYFIPKENMFKGKVEGNSRDIVQQILSEIITERSTFLYRIKTDKIGNYFLSRQNASLIENLEYESKTNIACQILQNELHVAPCFIYICFKTLQEMLSDDDNYYNTYSATSDVNTIRLTKSHVDFMSQLKGIPRINEHTDEETKKVINLLEPFCRTSLACHYAAIAIQLNDMKKKENFLRKSFQEFDIELLSNPTSSRLKYATVLYTLGKYEDCEEQLILAEKAYGNHVTPISILRQFKHEDDINEHMLDIIKEDNSTTYNIFRCFSFPIIFLPTEKSIVPEALLFEMFRSYGTPSDSRFSFGDFWYDWAVVDSQVYLYFLWYLLYKRMGKSSSDRIDKLQKMKDLLKEEDVGYHRETAFNMLSWMYASEHMIPQALQMLKMSWTQMEKYTYGHDKGLQKTFLMHHNAAKWHLLMLIFEHWRTS